jgi:hypothetical protein
MGARCQPDARADANHIRDPEINGMIMGLVAWAVSQAEQLPVDRHLGNQRSSISMYEHDR